MNLRFGVDCESYGNIDYSRGVQLKKIMIQHLYSANSHVWWIDASYKHKIICKAIKQTELVNISSNVNKCTHINNLRDCKTDCVNASNKLVYRVSSNTGCPSLPLDHLYFCFACLGVWVPCGSGILLGSNEGEKNTVFNCSCLLTNLEISL